MKYLLLVLISLSCISCDKLQNASAKEEDLPNSYSQYDYNVFESEKKQIICDGNVDAYSFMETEQADNGNERDLLAYALLMANKYNYGWANYTVYNILRGMDDCESGCDNHKLNCLDDKTRAMALEYLVLAVEAKDKDASSYAQEEYNRLKSEGIIE